MKPTITVSLLPALLICSFAEAHVSAADWPQWRGPSRDGKADFKVPTTWPKELTKKWQVTVGDGVSTPALADGKLYVFTRENGKEVARCLDAATGKELWRDKEAYEVAAVGGPASGYTGPRQLARRRERQGHYLRRPGNPFLLRRRFRQAIVAQG